ncbi:MAG TPA: NAD-dependent epimerase/dehydratase family protein [Polyangiales bacterium]|nr:NAD-dependent epimerase/dehydratase family protein [Polyangiales bacterium]
MSGPASGAGPIWAGRNVLVTGGSGLLGSYLVARLCAAGACVVCVLREGSKPPVQADVKVVRADVRDAAAIDRALREHAIATVFHVAGQALVGTAMKDPVSTFEINVAGTWGLLEACRKLDPAPQVLLASSDKAYGVHERLPYTEDSALLGRAPYEASKACADLIAQSFAHSYGLPIAITRCGNFYGGGDLNWNRVVPGTIRALLRGERPLIRSNGRFVRDYLYIEDGAAAYMTLAEQLIGDPSLRGEAFNFAGGESDVLGLVERIRQAMGSELQPVVLDQASNEIPVQILSSAKALARLGWKPAYSLDQGLAKTIAWYREHLAHD